jgi:hypothetical protein
MNTIRARLVAAAIAVLASMPLPSLSGQGAPPPAAAAAATSGDSLTVSLLTMGNGANVWELFGHNAIWIHDAVAGSDSVYDWGRFTFEQEGFILNFLRGRMLYSMGYVSIEDTKYQYQRFNRAIWIQELDLTAAEKLAIRDLIRINLRPENFYYRYDYFLDNCSTRIRDLLDRVVGGAVRTQLTSRSTRTTYRSHSLRLMQNDKPLVTGVDIGLGRPADKQLTEWEEAFLPTRLQAALRGVTLDGGARRLVKSERLFQPADREPEPAAPPPLGRLLLATSVIFIAIVGVLATRRSRGPRLVAAILVGVSAILAGIIGTILTLLWTLTDHVAAHNNENLLLINPLWFGAIGIAIVIARSRGGRVPRLVARVLLGLTTIALLLHVVGLSRQDNWAVIALVLPIALGFVVLERLATPTPATAYPQHAPESPTT